MQVGSSLGDCILRSSDYLNWRYRRHPAHRYELLAAYREGKLQAYCIFLVMQDEVLISDLFGTQDKRTIETLLSGLIELCHRRSIAAMNISVLASDPRIELLQNHGFWSRESVPVVTCGGNRFLLMNGDRES